MCVEIRQGDIPFERVILISPDPEVRCAVLQAAERRMDMLESRTPDQYPEPAAILAQHPDLCFIEVGTNIERALALIRAASDSSAPVVALSRTADSDLILRSLRCGAVEFFSLPIDSNGLADALARMARRLQGGETRPRPGRIWMIIPAKPNYGATTIACNIAVRVKKLEQRPVLLLDMDPLLGSVAFLLRLRGASSIVDAISGAAHLDRDLWKKLTVEHSGVDILTAPEHPRNDDFDPALVTPLVRFCRDNYAVTVVDSPGPGSPWQIALAKQADELILVTTNELAAIHACHRALLTLEDAGIARSRIRLVVNRYLRENGLSEDAIETGLKLEVFHVLPNDYEAVQAAILEARTVSSGTRLCRALDELCGRFTGFAQVAPKKSWIHSVPQLLKTRRA
jgi:pilus assembly protein CpaE